MSRREAVLSGGLVFVVALAVRAWAASVTAFPRPEDVAYYVGVARNLVEGRGLTTDAIWSFQTPPLSFPRPAFEVWLPLPSFLMAVPMALLGTTFAAAQVASVVVGGVVAVLAWRLGADVAEELALPRGRARTLAVGTGLTSAVSLPLVLASAQPDSTAPFTALVLGACLLMYRLVRAPSGSRLIGLGVLLGLAAWTRNEAIWLAVTWAVVAWWSRPSAADLAAGEPSGEEARAHRRWPWLVGVPAVAAVAVFAPWALRDLQAFGSPLPGQALTNALSLSGTDIFAWQERPTLARYLDAGLGTLVALRWTGFLHNLLNVLLLLGIPASVLGLVGLVRRDVLRSAALRPLLLFSLLTFAVTVLVFPVATTWGTFLHASGAVHVLLIVSALLVLDAFIAWVGVRRGWTNPVAWLGPTFAIAGSLLFTAVSIAADGRGGQDTAARYAALPAALAEAGFPLDAEAGPVITDFPIWFAEETRHHALALPDEPIDSVLSLARSFDPPARLVIFDADNTGKLPSAILDGRPGADCFVPVALPAGGQPDDPLDSTLVFRIRCP